MQALWHTVQIGMVEQGAGELTLRPSRAQVTGLDSSREQKLNEKKDTKKKKTSLVARLSVRPKRIFFRTM